MIFKMNSIITKNFISISFLLTFVACTGEKAGSNLQTLTLSSAPQKVVFLDNSGQDPRVPMTTTTYPWSSIGRIYYDNGNGTLQICTATMVGRKVAVTAAHCVLKNRQVVGVTFQADYNQGSFTAQAKSKEIEVGTTNTDNLSDTDWAVIELDSPIGDQLGYLGVDNIGDIASPVKVSFVGYSVDFNKGEIAGVVNSCYIQQRFSDQVYGHDCSMNPGASGGPLFATDGQGSVSIKAINTRGFEGHSYSPYSPTNANIAVMSQALVNAVVKFKALYD